MLSNEQHYQEAQELFFQSDLTQQQIADQVNVSRKTIGQWMQKGRWREMKKAATQAPGIVLQDFYDQLTSLNDAICTRTEAPYPTAEESVIQRRLMMSIKSFELQPASNYIQIFTELLDDIVLQDLELAQKMVPYTNSIVQRMAERSKMRTGQHMFLTDEDSAEEETNAQEATQVEDLSPSPFMERAGVRCSPSNRDVEDTTRITSPDPSTAEDQSSSPFMERAGIRCNPNVTSCNVKENDITQQRQGFDDNSLDLEDAEHFLKLPPNLNAPFEAYLPDRLGGMCGYNAQAGDV